ncbi:biotin/lipoyl-binding protein [bacterium]|nr:biotin/lipoyl-binding protein [bacterium]
MKIYKVKVNGKVYEVELEAVSETSGKIEDTKKEETTNENSKEILAPIAGKVVSVNINVGDRVSKNQLIAVIEAMKLENEVVSPYDGVVKEIKVTKSSQVNNKDVLVILG